MFDIKETNKTEKIKAITKKNENRHERCTKKTCA